MDLRISENIRTYRKQRNMMQEQLAEILGVSVGAVSKWERASQCRIWDTSSGWRSFLRYLWIASWVMN